MATWTEYEQQVHALEVEGMTTGDAQGIVDMAFNILYGQGWERNA